MKKKLLFLIHDLGPGGAEKVLVNLLNHLDRSTFDITLLTLFGGGVNEQFLKKDIRYKAVFKNSFPGNSRLFSLFSPRLLHRLFIHEEYDTEIAYLEGPSARVISGCPVSTTKKIAWIHVEQHTKEIASKAFRSYTEAEACYNRFDRIVFVSQYVKDDFCSIFPACKAGDILYNTNETAQIRKHGEEPVQEGLFKDTEIKICGVGKLLPNKGFDKLARIHVKLLNEGLPVHTYLLGEGPERVKIERYIKQQHCGETFTFLGYQTNPYKYVKKCDLFVCASVSEGFSTAATEALILGTAVVTTPVSGMKEMLGEDNEYGIVANEGEEALYREVRKMVSSPEQLAEYKKRAKDRGLLFSTENAVRAVEEMIKKL